MATKRGQAMMELAIGMFVLVLVVMTLTNFTKCIVAGLDQERVIRSNVGKRAQNALSGTVSANEGSDVEVDSFAAEYIFGVNSIKVNESLTMPAMSGIQ